MARHDDGIHALLVHLGHILPRPQGDFFDCLARHDVHAAGDGARSDGVIARHHHHFDAGFEARQNSLRNTFTGGVNEGHEAAEVQVGDGEVHFVGVKRESQGKGSRIKRQLCECKHALAPRTQLEVCGIDGRGVKGTELCIHAGVRAHFGDALGGTLDQQHVRLQGVVGGVDGQLPLVGGVEGDGGNGLEAVAVPVARASAIAQFRAQFLSTAPAKGRRPNMRAKLINSSKPINSSGVRENILAATYCMMSLRGWQNLMSAASEASPCTFQF